MARGGTRLNRTDMRGTSTHELFVRAVAALFFCAHLVWLPGRLEDIDSLNFALGLQSYDIAAHQPHPPGYPVFILLAEGATAVAALMTPEGGMPSAVGMALLSACAGAIALLALFSLLRTIEDAPLDATAITTLTAVSPLFWLTASRPLSDTPGLAAALVAQWLIVRAVAARVRTRDVAIAALACGVAAGIRSQVAWLVVPLLVWLLWRAWRAGGWRVLGPGVCAAAAGVLAWAIPMVVLTGGVGAYRAALASQAGEDFEGVAMLVMQPGVRRLSLNLVDTWVWPWGWWPLAIVVLTVAIAGLAALYRRRGVAHWLALGFGPYVLYHLLLQETETTRYALPVIPVCATLFVLGARVLARRWAPAVVSLVALACLGVSVQAHRQYVSSGMAIPAILDQWAHDARQAPSRPQVLMHRRVWAETRRARGMQPHAPYNVLPSTRALEWREATRLWESGGDPIVWWMVDPRRGDRRAIDPRSQRRRRHIQWPMPADALLGGMRPHAFDWYDVTAPQWALLGGWALTPEIAGLAAAAKEGPSTTGAHALVRRLSTPATLVLGGRHIGAAGDRPLDVDVHVGDTWVQRVSIAPGPFAYTWPLPAASAGAAYQRLTVRVSNAPAGGERLSLEQFDVQPQGVPVVALLEGWHEPERDPGTGRQWRWMSDRSAMQVSGASGDVQLTLAGTWPRHYDHAPRLEAIVGGRVVATYTLSRPFRVTTTITAAQLKESGGRIEWRAAPSFVAGERTGTADARRLALEIASVRATVEQ